MSDQPVANVSTYTKEHTKRRTNINSLRGIRTRDISVQTLKAYALVWMATGIGPSLGPICVK
jgi:hypothetical protein